MTPKLSICIPTYNRATYLPCLIDSIVAQGIPEVEIVVSDNASNDATAEVIADYARNGVRITYSCAERNAGADRNYLRAVALASGSHCWIVGSDDALEPGSIAAILELLASDPGIILVDRIECDRELKPVGYKPWLRSDAQVQTFDGSRPEDLVRYFRKCRRQGAIFSYLSSIVFRKSAWDGIDIDLSFIGTAYIHAFILLKMLHTGCSLTYVRTPLVRSRGGNDAFLAHGWFKRRQLDIHGYRRLGDAAFADNVAVRKAFFSVMHHEDLSIGLAARAHDHATSEEWSAFSDDLIAMGYSRARIAVSIMLSEKNLFGRLVRSGAMSIYRARSALKKAAMRRRLRSTQGASTATPDRRPDRL